MILFLMYTFLGVVGYKYFYEVTNDTLNPFSLSLFFWLIPFGLCALRLNNTLPLISFKTHIVVIVVALIISFAGLLTLTSYDFSKKQTKERLSIELTIATMSISTIM